MKMTKFEVMTMLGISTFENEIAENVLELCDINPEYDGEEVCRFYAKAVTFFKEYLPEYYVAELLGVNVDDLLNMNLEYLRMPVEMQCLFYDSYPVGKFKYSKFVYKSIQVYKVLGILSKSVFLKIPRKYAKHYNKSFVSIEAAVSILGFTKVHPALYHFYLMKLNIRYNCTGGKKKYLIDDICNVLEKAIEVHDKYISFNETCELYCHNSIRYICVNNISLSYGDSIAKYDVVSSDTRFKHQYKESKSFFDKYDVHERYLGWFSRKSSKMTHKYIGLSTGNFNFYENNNEYETLNLLCKMWDLEGFEYNSTFEKALKRQGKLKKIESLHLYRIYDFAKQYEKAIYYIALKNLNIKTSESDQYFYSAKNRDSLSFYFIRAKLSPPNWIWYISRGLRKYVSNSISKYWDKVKDYRYNIIEDTIKNDEHQYVSFTAHKLQCLKIFYTAELFNLHSNIGCAKDHVNLDYTCLYNFNQNLQNLINDDYLTAMNVKNLCAAQMIVTFLQQKRKSNITVCEYLDKSIEYWPILKVIMYLNLDKYSITLTWAILHNLELSLFYYRENIYMIAKEIIALRNYINDLLDEYIPVKNLYYLLHNSRPIVNLTNEIVAPPAMFYFLMPENHRGFYLIKKISQNLLDEVYNERVNCDTLLTAAEVQNNLYLLPSKIPSRLAVHLLQVGNSLDKLERTYSLFADGSNVFCRRDSVIKLVELQKAHQTNYVLEDYIPQFLNINIESLSEKDREILKTISVYKTPDYIINMTSNKNLTNNRAYLKEDVIGLRDFFHVSRNTQYDIKVDNNISGKEPYQTYLMRQMPLGLEKTLEHISPISADIWDGYIRLQLSTQQRSEEGVNSMINQCIKALNILVNMFQDNEITEISDFQTGVINRSFNYIASVTYCSILMGFFKYAAIMYAEIGIKPKYRIAELKIPVTKKENPDDILPETYSFREYSKLFNYCNDYYIHVEIAVREILEKGTCIYASTWFYVMSHLNNAWRSSDFSMFPYIDIMDIVYRNTYDDINWYLNNRISKSDATIIVLRIQNNPKVISKTKKYTRFTCSDELLITYATVYSLLSLYTAKHISYNIGFVSHFENKYNGVSKAQLDYFFLKFGIINFRFKSKKLNKTLLSLIDFLENYYIDNDIDTERRQAMLLRSHVKPSSTAYYIKKSKEVFDRLTNMICARGEFGYAYEMMIRSVLDTDNKLSLEDMTDKIRRIRYMIPNMKDIDILYGFLNYTHQEQASLNEYVNSLSLEELQTKLTKLYLNHLGSKTDKYLPCIKNICNYSHGNKDECMCCIFHIPSIYSLSVICQSIKEDINCYRSAVSDITRKKIISKLFKKSRDIIWAKQKYGDEILREILAINGTDYDQFLLIIENFLATQKKMKQIVGDKIDA